MHCEISSWSNVRYIHKKVNLRYVTIPFFRSIFLSITLWNERIHDIYWWVYCPENQRMANRHRLLWIFRRRFIHQQDIRTENKAGCKPSARQLFEPYEWTSSSNIWSLDQNYHRFLCKSTLKKKSFCFLSLTHRRMVRAFKDRDKNWKVEERNKKRKIINLHFEIVSSALKLSGLI